MSKTQFNFVKAANTFKMYLDELNVRVHGGIYDIPGTDDTEEFHGLNYTEEIREILSRSTKKEESFVALRDAERIITDIQEVRLSAKLIKVELKSVLRRPDLNKNPQVSQVYKQLQDYMEKVSGYLEICDKQYDFLVEILFGVSQVNISINRRFFNGENMMYNYKE